MKAYVGVTDIDWYRSLLAMAGYSNCLMGWRSHALVDVASDHSAIEAIMRHRLALEGSPALIAELTRGQPALSIPRMGQQAFKAVVAEKYHQHCAITGDKVRPVLQAAHVRPVAAGGEHRIDNGLLRRSDVHTLFDRGYLGIDLRHRFSTPCTRAPCVCVAGRSRRA